MNKLKDHVVICGMGYVGLTLAVVMAEKGFRIFGVEINKKIVMSLRQGKSHFYEKNIDKKLKKVLENKKLSIHQSLRHIEKSCLHTFIITVGTPLNTKKKVRTDMIKRATKEISKSMTDNSLIILRSTVKVGTTNNLVSPILKKSGRPFSLSFCPERTLEGDALAELEYLPQIIGGIDKKSVDKSRSIFRKITRETIEVSNLETAEMIKLVDNTSRDLFFAYSNEIAYLSDNFGSNINEIINAGKKNYKRTNIALPGLVGGPCLSKDSYILNESAKDLNQSSSIIMEGRKRNECQPEYALSFLSKFTKELEWSKKIKVAVLGIAFKGYPDTDDLRGSMSIPIIQSIKKNFPQSKIYGYDPLVLKKNILSLGIHHSKSIDLAIKNSHLVIIANNHRVFKNPNISSKSKLLKKNGIIYDFWNTMKHSDLPLVSKVHYISVGTHKISIDLIRNKLIKA